MSSQELFLIGGFPIAVINGFQLSKCGGVLHKQREIRRAAFRGLDGGKQLIAGGGSSSGLFLQFLIAVDTVFREEIHGLCRLF